ncbi:hypothetical protein OJAG_06350 [Oerskovia enterophila]|uniref:Uncharacterized protein n=1 Tax=Oerskovia enterophila TaxID=43678 RepID=A0A163SQ14_9CELL|nr:hypothetical protein OJAG_06350 [Oerskovia enterophila]
MSSRFSSAVSDAMSCGCWNTIPIRSRRSRAASEDTAEPAAAPPAGALTTSSPMRTWPAVGVVSVAATASRLDLPEPDGPSTAVVVPAGTVRETSSTAVTVDSPSG